MLSQDKSDKCIFYNKYFLDDLFPYKYDFPSKISYYNEGQFLESKDINFNSLTNFIDLHTPIEGLPKDVWMPVFIRTTNSLISNKTLYKGSSSTQKNIGIENAMSFEPILQNWDVTNAKMTTDWIITPRTSPFTPTYGLLFWYKNTNNPNLLSEDCPYDKILKPIETYTDGIITVNTSTKLVRKTKDLFYILDKDTVSYSTDHEIRPIQPKVFSIKKYIAYQKTQEMLSATMPPTIPLPKFSIDTNDTLFNLTGKPDIVLSIPDGEMYSFIYSEELAETNYVSNIISKSYLSPVLYPIYRQIYHYLTLNYTRQFDKLSENDSIIREHRPYLNLKDSRILKKIAYILSTMPLIDRATVSYLDDYRVFDLIDSFIANQKILTLDQEINEIKALIVNISKVLTDITSDIQLPQKSLINSNIVRTNKDLFYRLLSKYGSKLVFSQTGKLTYKKQLKYGPHVKINQDINSKCDINLQNTVAYNNIIFNVGNFKLESKISDNDSYLLLKNTTVDNKNNKIPLWDIAKKNIINRELPISAGPDIEAQFTDSKLNNTKELEISLDKAVIDFGVDVDPDITGGEDPEIEWKRISGPDCLRFSNNKLTGNKGSYGTRFKTSYDFNPTVYIKKPGKYILQLTVKTSFAVAYDIVTIHATSFPPEKDVYTRTDPLLPAETKTLASNDKLTVILPNLRECAFGKQGVFWPMYSDCSVKVPVGKDNIQENLNNLPQPGGSSPPIVQPLSQSYHKFAFPMKVDDKNKKIVQEENASLSIEYKPGNTIIEVSKIILSNMLDKNDDCEQCLSFYQGVPDNDGFMLDIGSYSFYDIPSDTLVDVDGMTDLTTKKSRVKAYGGFDRDHINTLFENGERYIPFHPSPGQYLDDLNLTEDLLETPKIEDTNKIKHICFEMPLQNKDKPIIATKGYFHPFSGWLPSSGLFDNKTSVNNFKLTKPVLTFKGLGFYELNNEFIDSKPKIYKSKITLDVSEQIWNYKPPKDEKPPIPKELPDQIVHYGYRAGSSDVSLKTLAYSDETDSSFSKEGDESGTSDSYCLNVEDSYYNECSYTMTQPGAGGAIRTIEIKLNNLNYVNPKDLIIWLEVDPCEKVKSQLNPPKKEAGDEGGGQISSTLKDPWVGYSDIYKRFGYMNHETPLKKYLHRLWDINDNSNIDNTIPDYNWPFDDRMVTPRKVDPKYYLYLLYQDNIDNNELNTSIYFTDNLDHYTNSTNKNIINVNSINNNYVSQCSNNTIYLPPTQSAPNFNDKDSFKFINMMKIHRLYNNSHRFNKFTNMPMYDPAPSEDAKADSSSISFTLCIAIMNESEDIESYDRLVTTDASIGFVGSKKKNISNLINSSLCSWELIVHKTDSLGFRDGDALGYIDYQNPPITGYNFMLDLSNNIPSITGMPNKRFLLPPVNLNAPNEYMADGRLCHYSKESLNVPAYLPPQTWVPSMIIPLMPFTLIGAMVSLELVGAQLNQQAKDLANYFGSIRRSNQAELFNRKWFVPKYNDYAFGSADKMLISASKDDGKTWYKMEASVFRYDNSLVLKKNKHKFYRLHYKSLLRSLSIFKPSLPKSYDLFIKDLFKDYIIEIYIPIDLTKTNVNQLDLNVLIPRLEELKNKENLLSQSDVTTNDPDIAQQLSDLRKEISNLSKTIQNILTLENYDIIKLMNQEDEKENTFYIYKQKFTEKYGLIVDYNKVTTFNDLYPNQKICLFNEIFNLSLTTDKNNDDPVKERLSLEKAIENKIIVVLNGIRPYHFFRDDNFSPVDCVTFKEKTTDEYSDEELQQLEDLNNQLKNLDPQSEQILDLNNQIWDLTHHKYDNQVISAGFVHSINKNSYKTILVLKSELEGNILSVDPEKSKRILVYDNEATTTITKKKETWPINFWEFGKHRSHNFKTPVVETSAWGVGNYGYGANIVRQNILTNQQQVNQIKNIQNILDINKNSVNNIGNIFLKNNDNNILSVNAEFLAYCYDFKELSHSEGLYTNIEYLLDKQLTSKIKASHTKIGSIPFNAYNKDLNTNKYFVEFNINTTGDGEYEYGELSFDKDVGIHTIYKAKNFTIENLISKQTYINNKINELNEEITMLNESGSRPSPQTLAYIEALKNRINSYKKQYMSIEDTKNKLIVPESSLTNIGHIDLKLRRQPVDVSDAAGGISEVEEEFIFDEIPQENLYWINIDANQSCSLDMDKTIKILKSVTIDCIRFNDLTTRIADQICVPNGAYGGVDSFVVGNDPVLGLGKVQQDTSTITYEMSVQSIESIKTLYDSDNISWPEDNNAAGITERYVFLNFAGIEKPQLVKITHKYILPIIEENITLPYSSTVKDRVYNIFNLNNTDNLKVIFKRIPRTIKNADTNYAMYDPDKYGNLSKSITPPDGGPIDPLFKTWQCIDTETKLPTDPPVYYKWLNEMMFRAIYGSVDKIEQKGAILAESKDETYWIPYDYS